LAPVSRQTTVDDSRQLLKIERSLVCPESAGVPFPRIDDVTGCRTRIPTIDDAHERPIPADAAVGEVLHPVVLLQFVVYEQSLSRKVASTLPVRVTKTSRDGLPKAISMLSRSVANHRENMSPVSRMRIILDAIVEVYEILCRNSPA
jgi:hypothetical protein